MKKKKNIWIWGFMFFLASCAMGSGAKFIRVYFPDGRSINAELAVTMEQRARGLMFRKELDADEGMLFVFEKEDLYAFWMKNCLISLDILWLDKDKRIVHVETHVPPCKQVDCPSYSPSLPALYVLELKSGSIQERGIKLYDKVDFILTRNR